MGASDQSHRLPEACVILLFLTQHSTHLSHADSLQGLVSITLPVCGEGGKLGAVFADLQGLAAGLGFG